MRFAAILVVCVGCGRTSLPIESTGPTLGGVEGPWSWAAPQLLADVDALLDTVRTNANTNVFDPILSEDGLTLFLTSDIRGAWDVYALTRPSLTASFDQIALLGDDVNPPGVSTFGYQPLSAFNTVLAFGNYPVAGLGAAVSVIVFADTAVAPLTWRGTVLNFAFTTIIDPRLTSGGDALIFAVTGGNGLRNLYLSQRQTIAEDFQAAVRVEGLTAADDSAPWLSPDKRVLVFANADGVSQSTSELWSATRVDANAPFANADPIAEVNSPFFDGEPYVFESGDTCELYIVSTRLDNLGFRLYRSTMIR